MNKGFLKKAGAFLTAASVCVSSAAVFGEKVSAAGSITLPELQSRLGPALEYAVFTRHFENYSDMEGNICVENGYIGAHDATNSDNNYDMYENNQISVVFSGTEGESITFALFTKSGTDYEIVSGTRVTLTIPAGQTSVTYTYTHSEALPLFQTNTYYLAQVDALGNILEGAEISKVNANNNVSNKCYIQNLQSIWGNFTREQFDDLVICLDSFAYNRLDHTYNNGNGVVIYANDNSSVAYNTKLNLKQIGVDEPAINFDVQFANMCSLSNNLAELTSDSSNVKVINITAEELCNYMYSNNLFNVQLTDSQYAVLNIDADSDVFTVDNKLKLAYKINGELGQWNLLASRVLVNIYDSTAPDKIFTGGAICYENGGTMGTILAPGAVYESGPGNTNGSVIAKKILLTAGEIHKIPFGILLNAKQTVYIQSDTATTYDFSFTKITADTSPLAGAEFTLYSDAAYKTALKKSVSDNTGKVTFTGLIDGTYYMKETSIPEGYMVNSSSYIVTVNAGVITVTENAGASVTLGGDEINGYTITNTVATNPYTNLVLNKTNGYSPISGAGFTLYTDIECTIALGAEHFSDISGVTIFRDLKAGTYYLKETTIPTGYKDNGTVYKVVINDACDSITINGSPATGSYTIVNNLIPKHSFSFTKTTEDGVTPLSGAAFTLYSDSACKHAISASISDSSGKVLFTSLIPGVYHLKETNVPAGYIANDTVYTVIIAENGAVNMEASIAGTLVDNGNGSYNIKNLKTAPTPEAGNTDIELIKTFGGAHLNTAELLSQTTFTLYDNASLTENAETMTASPVWDGTKAVVSFEVPTPVAGSKTWYLKETKAPFGYKVSKNIYECSVASDGTVTYRIFGTGAEFALTAPVCNNENYLLLIKQYAGENLSTDELLNATEFTLYKNYNGTELLEADVISRANPKWNAEKNMAIVSFQDVYAPDSGFVIYYLKETASPVAYSTSDVIYECKIDSNGNVTYREYGSNAAFSETFPICNNLKVYDPAPPIDDGVEDPDSPIGGGDGGNSPDGPIGGIPGVTPDGDPDDNTGGIPGVTPDGDPDNNTGGIPGVTPDNPSTDNNNPGTPPGGGGNTPSTPPTPNTDSDDSDKDNSDNDDDDSDSDDDDSDSDDDDSDSDDDDSDSDDDDSDSDDDDSDSDDDDSDSDDDDSDSDDDDSDSDDDDDLNTDDFDDDRDSDSNSDDDYISNDDEFSSASGEITDESNPFTSVALISSSSLAILITSGITAFASKKRKK